MAKFEIDSGIPGGGGPWVLDLDTLMYEEGIECQKLTGFGHLQWVEALTDDDPRAIRYAFYLARRRAGEDVAWGDVGVDLFRMQLTLIPAEGDDDAQVGSEIPEDVAGVVPTGPGSSDEVMTSS